MPAGKDMLIELQLILSDTWTNSPEALINLVLLVFSAISLVKEIPIELYKIISLITFLLYSVFFLLCGPLIIDEKSKLYKTEFPPLKINLLLSVSEKWDTWFFYYKNDYTYILKTIQFLLYNCEYIYHNHMKNPSIAYLLLLLCFDQ